MYYFWAIAKGSIYYLTATEHVSSAIPTREVTTSYNLKHKPARVPISNFFKSLQVILVIIGCYSLDEIKIKF